MSPRGSLGRLGRVFVTNPATPLLSKLFCTNTVAPLPTNSTSYRSAGASAGGDVPVKVTIANAFSCLVPSFSLLQALGRI